MNDYISVGVKEREGVVKESERDRGGESEIGDGVNHVSMY